MTRSRIALIAVILLVVIAGGIVAGLLLTESDSPSSERARYVYPKSAVHDIRSSCERRLKTTTCDCVVAAFESTMPFATYQQFAREGVTQETRDVVHSFQLKSANCPR